MKNICRRRGTVHPSPPLISGHLAFLPATILTLAVALSPEDREVLAYLISCSSTANFSGHHEKTNTTHKKQLTASLSSGDHPPSFTCNCFRCYTSYWARWDLSPSRQTIHEIIDALEEEQLGGQRKREKSRRERRKRGSKRLDDQLKGTDQSPVGLNYKDELGKSESVEENVSVCGGGEGCCEGEEEEEVEKGSVRKFVSFVGEKLWSTVWS